VASPDKHSVPCKAGVCVCVSVCECVCVCVCLYGDGCLHDVNKEMHTYTHVHLHTYTTHVHKLIYTHTYTHTRTHTHTHTQTHTHTCTDCGEHWHSDAPLHGLPPVAVAAAAHPPRGVPATKKGGHEGMGKIVCVHVCVCMCALFPVLDCARQRLCITSWMQFELMRLANHFRLLA